LRGPRDDHGNPGTTFLADGRLAVFYSGHSRSPMYYRVSSKPLAIDAWDPELRVNTNVRGGNGHTYANPHVLPAENSRLYFFFRGGNWQPCMTWTDDLKTWAKAVHVIQAPKRTPPYVKYVNDGESRIHLVYSEGHPKHLMNSIYYACYYDGAFHQVDGTTIGDVKDLPFAAREGDLVYDASAGKARGWTWDIALDQGKPVIVHSAVRNQNDHRYRYARWTGDAWENHEITGGGGTISDSREAYYSGGIILDHENPNVVYLSRQTGKTWEIERWQTSDGGETWKSRALTRGTVAPSRNVRPITVYGHTGDELQVLWMAGWYKYWADYKTSLVGWPMTAPPVQAESSR
jgi:hypothetical protein